MARVVVTIPGERVVQEFDALVERSTLPETAKPPRVGLVEISQRQPTELIPGPVGPQGVRGSRWFTGSGVPGTIVGQQLGDMYLDDATDHVWQFDGAAWNDTGTDLHGSPDTGADILVKLAPVDGAGSGLDADMVDGEHAVSLHAWANLTGKPATFPPTLPIAESDVTNLVSDLALKAPLASPGLTGTPTAPTAAGGTNTTQIASTAFVEAATAPAQLLVDIKTVDGVGSGLDADLLDGNDSAFFRDAGNLNAGILPAARFNDTAHGARGGGTLHAIATAAVAGFLLDAPSDGSSYARRNAAWVATSAFVDAPSDGSFYGRVNAAWTVGYTKAALDTLLAAKAAGPAASTDNALVRFDLATGKVIQNSGAILDDSNNLSGIAAFTTTGAANIGTNLIAGGTVQANNVFQSVGTTWIAATVGAGTLYLRPNGYASAVGQVQLDSAGTFTTSGAMLLNDGTVSYRAALVSGGQVYTGTFSNHNVNVQVNNSVVGTWSAALLTVAGTINFQGTLQSTGGAILGTTGAANVWLRPSGAASATGQMTMAAAGNSTWSHDSQAKPTAGGFIASSDERIKTVVREYDMGLDAIKALHPVVFVFRGNDTDHPPDEDPADALLSEEALADRTTKPGIDLQSVPYPMSVHYQLAVDGTERIGMIAQEIEVVLPETVTQRSAYIDGKPVDDLRDFDPTNIIYALVNAVKELETRLAALEAAR
jgi:hypothetical protein